MSTAQIAAEAATQGESVVRKVSGLLLVVMMALLLAACGDDDDGDTEPTEAATQPPVSTATTGEAEEPTEVATVADSTPESGITGVASPEASPVVVASPVIPSPVAVASPVASPAASPVAATPLAGIVAPAAANDDASAMVSLTGTVTLPGAENETYVVTNDGCVGIGAFAGMQPGRQVVVRDEAGSIIGVATLVASPDAGGCAWQFAVDVPESAFYAVSIPMVVEHVFTSEDVAQNDGSITIPLT